MASNGNGNKVASSAVVYTIMGLVMLAFILFGLWPQYRAIVRENEEIAQMRHEIEIQKLLFPVYGDLTRKAKFDPPQGLPMPKKRKMARDEIGRLPEVFTQAAKGARLEFEKVLPQVNLLKPGQGLLPVEVAVRGQAVNVPEFIIKIAEIPYLEHVERISIRRQQSFDQVGLRVWLVVE